MKKTLSFLILSCAINLLWSQTVIVNNKPGLNSAETEKMYRSADFFNTKAQEALDSKDYDKAIYYIYQWVDMGVVDGRLYKLHATCLLGQGYPKKAKRKLMKAYKKYGCYECKEQAEKIE